ncbi:MAG: DUF1801 domain-containing protein [Erysipelotrichaceae bacterium]|nr:DUF1801 domain-containing protein [Erysipelotrichaceae bacterium]
MKIEEYILSQDSSVQKNLFEVYNAIKEVLPFCEEKISWGMPTFKKERNIIHFASNKNHIGIYPGALAIEHFALRIKEKGYKFSKGAIQIPYSDNLPIEFIKEISLWCSINN